MYNNTGSNARYGQYKKLRKDAEKVGDEQNLPLYN
jgi:hypothetical protein